MSAGRTSHRLPRAALAAALLACALPATALAQAGALHAGQLEVPLNKSQVVSADRPIARAMVGNPEVADVLPISERSVYVLGKKFGTTSLTLYDRLSRVIAVMDIAVGPDVVALRSQLGQLVPNQTIDVRISNESVILSGLVNDSGAADRAMQIAKSYAGDKVINLISMGASQQVMLEVRFAEVNRQIGEKLGVSGFGNSRGGTFGSAIGASASLTPNPTTVTTSIPLPGGGTGTTSATVPAGLLTLGSITDAFGIFQKSFSLGNIDIEAVLDVLERRGLSKTLAQPTLIALSGEKASFLAGGEFPIPVAQSGGSGGGGGGGGNAITVEFKPFGVGLSFTPTVLGDKVINMIIEPEVSSIDPTASVSINGIVVPGLQTRRASTTVELRDGESFAIAGLLRSDYQTTVRQLPGLGSIPILGALFRSSSFQKGETELLIVVTPRLVKPIRPDQVRLPTDRIEDPRPIDVLIDGEGYRPKALPPQSNASGGSAFEGAFPQGGQTGPAPVAGASELPPASPPAQPGAAQPAKDSDYAF